MSWDEYAKKRLRAEERAALMYLDMLARSFEYCVGKLEDRLKGYKWLRRDLGTMKALCRKVTDAALEGTEDDMAAQLLRQSRDFRLGLERTSPVKRTEECVMPIEDEWQFIHICLESRCTLCMLPDGECERCKIRKLLRKYCDEPEPGSLRACGYMGADLGDGDRKQMNRQDRL